MLPASAVIPKALLPVGAWPMLHWVLDECVRAGIGGVAMIVGPDQPLVREYVEVAIARGRGAENDDLARLGRGLAELELEWVVQTEPRGVGHAFMLARPITGDSPYGVLLPDNWFEAKPGAIAQVTTAFERTGHCAFGLTRVDPEEAWLFGNVGGVELDSAGGDTYRVVGLQDKLPGTFDAEQPVLRGCARYVVDGRFYDALDATGPPPDGEWDDVPAFQALIAADGLAAQHIQGRHYDVGHMAGYLRAAAYLAER